MGNYILDDIEKSIKNGLTKAGNYIDSLFESDKKRIPHKNKHRRQHRQSTLVEYRTSTEFIFKKNK